MELTKEELVIVRNILNYHCIHNVSFNSERHEEIQRILDKITGEDFLSDECGKEQ